MFSFLLQILPLFLLKPSMCSFLFFSRQLFLTKGFDLFLIKHFLRRHSVLVTHEHWNFFFNLYRTYICDYVSLFLS